MDRDYYIQVRRGKEIVEEWIDKIKDGDNIIINQEGKVILVIRYAEMEI